MCKNKILYFLLSMFYINGIAQELYFEHFNETKGLSHNSVRSIVQDDKGFLWLGTFGGVNRFDGYDFKVFTAKEQASDQLNSNDILQIVSDAKSNLWIATDNGLTAYHLPTSSFKTFRANPKDKHALVDDRVRSVYIDEAHRVWVGTLNNGLCYLDTNTNKFYNIDLGEIDNIRGITQSHDGRMWVTSFTKGVYSFFIDDFGKIVDLQNYTLYPNNETKKNANAYFIFEDKAYNVFVGTREGLFKLDKIDNTFKDTEANSMSSYFRCFTKAPDGSYWFGTSNGIIECPSMEEFVKGNFRQYTTDLNNPNSLVNNYIISLYFDFSGVLWVGTENGLESLNPFENQFKSLGLNFTGNNQIPIISSFAKTFDNNLLIGTQAQGVFLKKHDDFIKLLDSYSEISSIYTKDNIVFYIGLWDGGVVEYDYKNNKERKFNVGFVNSPVFAFYKISNNELLVGSQGEGLVKFDLITGEKDFIKNNNPKFKDINKILYLEHQKLFWIATEEGVFRYNRKDNNLEQYVHQDGENGLSNNKVKELFFDDSGRLWAGTREGLNYYDPVTNNFKLQTEPKELADNWITDIAVDSLGIMWLNLNYNKIVKYNPRNNDYKTFYVKNGVRSNLFNKRGFLHFNRTKIYVGGNKEIILFNPLDINENNNSPTPVISELKVSNNEIKPGETLEDIVVLNKDINYAKKIRLNYKNRNFTVKFSMPSYVSQRQNTFYYKLDGLDKHWNKTSSGSRSIQYANLPPGDYNLKLKATNNNGYESEISSYAIKVQPPFWLSPFFFIFIFILISIGAYFLHSQLKNRRRLKQELLFEKVRRERDEKLNNDKLRFFTNISHELRTPLTLILGPAKQLINNQNDDYILSRANLVYQNANRLLRLVNQILDFRRAETGELNLKVAKTDVSEHVKSIFNSFKELTLEKNISLSLNIESEDAFICWIDIDKFSKILYNLLSNAIKFTERNGNVDLFLGLKDNDSNMLILEVSDNGIGISDESHEKIFKRFYQARTTIENTGTGIGLSLVKALVDIHKGEIKVKSKLGSGSVFTVEIPVNKSAYNNDELFKAINSKLIDKEPKERKTNNQLEIRESLVVESTLPETSVKQKILVIEDNTELRDYVVQYLSTYYKVLEAKNGQEGLEICKKEKPVLCVVDVMMPVMDGFEFVESLKSDDDISHIAVILLTALAENENRIKGYSIGVDGYLTKPFDPALLKTRIDNIIKLHFGLKQRFLGEVDGDILTLAHSQLDIDLVSKIKEIIEDNISSTKLSPNFIAEEVGMSTSKLYRKIKQLTDLTPYEFIRTIQLKKSAQLLKTKRYNVSEVSDMIGFNDPFYFSKVFKKQFGYSPSKLLK
ncbi:hybrid sensor histidine kinase/response regulator transcription factor [Algibacter pectinivorans]|uniref:histidine kinase n=1 Tax=Algibacter pectinivorans TaxID=870482 RepID=A0A1I1MEG2_9FLAO|nr:two-component regulator propeller domain-containing protein [Algibacter pectinivorans]SFC80030.1 Signal transduction histidine kinase [Algibacter pectinivorans]